MYVGGGEVSEAICCIPLLRGSLHRSRSRQKCLFHSLSLLKESQWRRVPNIWGSATLTLNDSHSQEMNPDTSPKFFLLTVSSISDSVGGGNSCSLVFPAPPAHGGKNTPMPLFILFFSVKSNISLEGFAFLQRTCLQMCSKSLPHFPHHSRIVIVQSHPDEVVLFYARPCTFCSPPMQSSPLKPVAQNKYSPI